MPTPRNRITNAAGMTNRFFAHFGPPDGGRNPGPGMAGPGGVGPWKGG
ncbi:hypothetical protein [Streptomyces sp. AcE210]|nr:hypothetical protein [Streptomyces sp. AcE210]